MDLFRDQVGFIFINFVKSTTRLHFLLIFSMLANFPRDHKLIAISSIKCLNFKFFSLKLFIKNKFTSRIVNNTGMKFDKYVCE